MEKNWGKVFKHFSRNDKGVILNIVFLCSGLTNENTNLQPWRYILEIAKGLRDMKQNITIISTSSCTDKIHERELVINNVNGPLLFRKEEVLEKICECNPDMLIVQVGPSTVLSQSLLKDIHCPKIALWLGTKIPITELLKVGLAVPMSDIKPLITTSINSIISNKIIGLFLSKYFIRIVTLNNNNRNRLLKIVKPKIAIQVIPPGIDEFWFKRIDDQKESIRSYLGYSNDDIIMLYTGGASEIRGPGMLIRSFSHVCSNNAKLLLLVREHLNNKKTNINRIETLIQTTKICNKTNLIKGYLSIEDLRKYICISDIVILPFRMVQADTPLTIIECICQGKLIISSKTDGIPELLDNGRGYIIDPGNDEELTKLLRYIVNNPEELHKHISKSLEYAESYPKWKDITKIWFEVITQKV